MAGERLSSESVRILLGYLNDVQQDLARGVNPEDGEPDQHQAVRLAAYEIERARALEEILGDLANRAYHLLCTKFTAEGGERAHEGRWFDDGARELALAINAALRQATQSLATPRQAWWVVMAEHWSDDHREVVYGIRRTEAGAKALAAEVDAMPQPTVETREKADIVGPIAETA